MPTAMTQDNLVRTEIASPRRPYIGHMAALAALLSLGSMSVAAFAAGLSTGPVPAPIDPSTIQGLLNSQMETPTAAQSATAPSANPPAVAGPSAPATPAPEAKTAEAAAQPDTAKSAPAPAGPTTAGGISPAQAAVTPSASNREDYAGKPMAIDPRVIRGFVMPGAMDDANSAEPAPTESAEAAAPPASSAVVSSPRPAAPAIPVTESLPQASQPVVPPTPMAAPKPAPAVAAPKATVEPTPAGQPAPMDSDIISSFTGAQPDAATPASNRPLPSSQLDLIEKVFAPEQSQ